MSRRIYKDIEEALSRQIRRISFHENRTTDETVLEELFDPFTGEIVKMNVEPDFYDSSADTSHRQYPHIFIRLMKTREDLFTNRAGNHWGKNLICSPEELEIPISSERAYKQIVTLQEGTIDAVGNIFNTTARNIGKASTGDLLRLLNGDYKGTYTITSVIKNNNGIHNVEVSNTFLTDLPEFSFDVATRTITFLDSVDFTTIKIGDQVEDVSTNIYSVTSIDAEKLQLTIDGTTTPDTNSGAKISRTGGVFQSTSPDQICFLVLDPDQPILTNNNSQLASGGERFDAPIAMDAFYMVRIDSKEKDTHTEILNRVWEEFNPPRGALPTIIRSKDSAEEFFITDLPSGGSSSISVNNENFNVNDRIYIINDFKPTKSTDGGYQEVFSANIVNKVSNDTIVLDKVVPDEYTLENGAKVVSNADYQLLYLHFVDHRTRDVEGAQYWVHEFDFWVQFYIDRQGESTQLNSNITGISTPIEDL